MFARLFAVASLAALVVAGPTPMVARGSSDTSQCNTGSMTCCSSVQDAGDLNQALGTLGLVDVLAGITGQVGLGCSPITVIGTGSGATCTQEPVCCTGNTMNGLINIGCSPINLNA